MVPRRAEGAIRPFSMLKAGLPYDIGADSLQENN